MRGLLVAIGLAAMVAACEQEGEVRVIDADHLVVDGHKLQLYGIDAPSARRPHCDAEREAALRAKLRLTLLTAPPAKVTFRKIGMACPLFLNCIAFVEADGRDVADRLRAEGLVVEHTYEKYDWCAPPFDPDA